MSTTRQRDQMTREELEKFAEAVVGFIAKTLMDPHLYFEHKYRARIAACTSRKELRMLIAELVSWIDAGGLEGGAIAALDAMLAAKGLASIDEMGSA